MLSTTTHTATTLSTAKTFRRQKMSAANNTHLKHKEGKKQVSFYCNVSNTNAIPIPKQLQKT
jgi:hypothetical protein